MSFVSFCNIYIFQQMYYVSEMLTLIIVDNIQSLILVYQLL